MNPIAIQTAEIFSVPFLATREAVAPLANDPIISSRLIQLFRHLKHQNLSTVEYFIYSSGISCLVDFFCHQGGSGATSR